MYRITVMSGKVYAKKINFSDEQDIEDLETLVKEGTPSLIVSDLEDDLSDYGIDNEDIILV